jgi:hypothetical protein
MQDICVLGWAIDGTDVAQGTPATAPEEIAKSDGTTHYIWPNAMGSFVGCEELALAQRDYAGILLPQSTDPLSLV